MSERTHREKPVKIRGHLFIRLKSGRHLTFWDVLVLLESAHTDLGRSFSRLFKLAADDWDLERIEHRLDAIEEHCAALRSHLDKARGKVTKQQRIALLRNVEGRTPEEAEAFLRKADQLENELEEVA